MRKKTVFSTLACCSLLFAACSASRMEVKDLKSTALPGSSLIGKPGEFGNWLGTPIRFKKGDSIPVLLGLENAFICLKKTPIPFLVTRDFYVLFTLPDPDLAQFRMEKKPERKKALLEKIRTLFSNDGTHWAPLNSPRDLKEVFGIRHGTTRAFLSITKEAGLTASLWLETR